MAEISFNNVSKTYGLTTALKNVSFTCKEGEFFSIFGGWHYWHNTANSFEHEEAESNHCPVIILINNGSASASEIFAGAIQDYRRGLIVGHRTFGKGTVQSLENLSEGQIKITESKYYRINGMSTQNKGVVPDIELPSTWDINTVGESSYPTALSWDAIRPYRHKKFKIDNELINDVVDRFEYRLSDEPNLNYLKKIRNRYDLNKNKKLLSLKIDEYLLWHFVMVQ